MITQRELSLISISQLIDLEIIGVIEAEQKKAGIGDKHVITVTDTNIGEITTVNEFVLIDFWNERCEHCKELEPIIEKLAGDYAGRVAFGKLDVDKNRRTQIRFKVEAFPTLLILKNGKEAERIIGYILIEHIEAALKKPLNIVDHSGKPYNRSRKNPPDAGPAEMHVSHVEGRNKTLRTNQAGISIKQTSAS